MKKLITLVLVYVSKTAVVHAQTIIDSIPPAKSTNHFQFTSIGQGHAGFHSKYSGSNSLADSAEDGAVTVTATLFWGRALWKGAAIYVNPEISGGRGLSSTLGVAGALNGESYRVGNTTPAVFIARAFLRQYIPLCNSTYETVSDDVFQVAGKIPSRRITITAGKFAVGDFYDDNAYSHDPRIQFINWSLMGNGAWDYPANTRGYTMGFVVEWVIPNWAVRFSSVAVPRIANAPKMEYNITGAHSETLELERKIQLHERPGTLRFLFSNSYTKAPSYQAGINALATNNTFILEVIGGKTEGTTYGGKKFGLGYSFDQELTDNIGIFSRASWNDGKYATWAFTEIDNSFCLGIALKGNKWKRNEDIIGVAAVLNGISSDHRKFLALGGYGFIIGDGALNYGHEGIIETYYNCHLSKYVWITADYQFVNNPGYNKDRGPVHVFGLRAHVEL